GIGLVAYSPLGRGFLTGGIHRVEDFAPDDFRRNSPRFQGDNFQKNLALVEKIRELSAAKGVTPAQLALRWVVDRGKDIEPLPGTKRRSYLEENVSALNVTLTEADTAALEALMPRGAVSGERYSAAGMRALGH